MAGARADDPGAAVMKGFILSAAIGLAALAATTAAIAQPAVQQQRDWSRTIVATPEGGALMGNPAAAIKVVEYVSLSCSHCREFARTGAPALIRDHVAGGRVSFEIRAFPLDPIAAVGAQLNRCAAPDHYFALNDDILRAQEGWIARLDALTEAEVTTLRGLAPAALRQRIATLLQFDAIAARHGVDTQACLADDAGAARIDEIKAAGEAIGIRGTPSFTLNGQVASGVHHWDALAPLLAAPR